MAQLSKKDWQQLTEPHSSEASLKKETLFKFGISLFLLCAFLVFAYLQHLTKDFALAAIILPPNIIGLVLVAFAKKSHTIKWITYLSLLIFLMAFTYIGLSLDDTRGLIYFVSFAVLYNFELERLAWNKWLIFIFCLFTISALYLFNIEVFSKVSISLIFIFISGVVYQGNKRRQELQLLKESEASYNLFIKHTRLIEHNVINSISKLVYVSEMLKSQNNSPDIQELTKLLDSEIKSIEEVILKTNKDSLNNFEI